MIAKGKRGRPRGLRFNSIFTCRMDVKDKGNILRAFNCYVKRNGILDKKGRRITYVDWVNAVLRKAILTEMKGEPFLKGIL